MLITIVTVIVGTAGVILYILLRKRKTFEEGEIK